MNEQGGSGGTVRLGSGAMFDAIAGRYDLLNRVMSLGLDRGWRRRAVRALDLGANARVLDLATGTADLAIDIARAYPTASVVGLDPSPEMLRIAGEKTARAGIDRISFVTGSAEELAFDDASFDGVTIAFGIRNVPDRARALREMARVTRPGGRVVVLELAEPREGWLGSVARLHVRHVLPRLGSILSGTSEYRYLQRSIAAFPPAEVFGETIAAAGLDVMTIEPLAFGACVLFVAKSRQVSTSVATAIGHGATEPSA